MQCIMFYSVYLRRLLSEKIAMRVAYIYEKKVYKFYFFRFKIYHESQISEIKRIVLNNTSLVIIKYYKNDGHYA